MSIIFVLIPLAIIIVSIAVGVFFWAVKSNQFEDLERQGYSILFDDDIKSENEGNEDNKSKESNKASSNSLDDSLADSSDSTDKEETTFKRENDRA